MNKKINNTFQMNTGKPSEGDPGIAIEEKEETKVQKPKMFKVLLHNENIYVKFFSKMYADNTGRHRRHNHIFKKLLCRCIVQ